MIVEGINVITELLAADYPVEKIILAANEQNTKRITERAKQKNVKVESVNRTEIEKITKSRHSQSVIAFVKNFEYCDSSDILNAAKQKNKPNFIVILDGIEDPQNVGNIIRTAECAGADGIIIGKNRCCPVNETVFKTSVGAVAHMKIAQVVNISQTIEKLKQNNIWVYALEAGSNCIFNENLTGPAAIVVGSEGKGVSALVKSTCDGVLSLPLNGRLNSLNAGNAAAIAIYEIVRQRKPL